MRLVERGQASRRFPFQVLTSATGRRAFETEASLRARSFSRQTHTHKILLWYLPSILPSLLQRRYRRRKTEKAKIRRRRAESERTRKKNQDKMRRTKLLNTDASSQFFQREILNRAVSQDRSSFSFSLFFALSLSSLLFSLFYPSCKAALGCCVVRRSVQRVGTSAFKHSLFVQ